MAWYEEMFSGEDPIRFETYAESEQSRAHVDFIIDKLDLLPGMRVLDLCCGQGRHLVDLARRGYEVAGVDLSEYMLGRCREAADRERLKPTLVRRDMREIDFRSEFDAVINMYTSFGYLESDDEDRKVLVGVSAALRPGGRFMVDMVNRDWLMRNFRDQHWERNSRGDVIVSESRFDSLTSRNNVRETAFHADGRRSEISFSLRHYTYQEMVRMMGEAGMTVDSVWGGYDSTPYSYTSRRMIIVAARK